jgi:hypothetical protein
MQNLVLINNATTLAVDQGKLFINNRSGSDLTSPEAQRFIPMDIMGIVSVTKQAGAAGTSRTQTLTPTAANSTVYSVTISVFKESDFGYFGPSLVTFTVSFTSDASATVAEICTGLTNAIKLVGAAYGVTATDGTTLVTVTSNTTAAQNINIISVGAGTIAVAETVAFAKAYGLAANLVARGLANAESGQVYTEYNFKVKQGFQGGHVNTGTEYLEQIVFCKGATGTLITAIDAFITAPLSSPAAYNL